MQIEFTWTTSTEDLSAVSLAGKVIAATGLALKPVKVLGFFWATKEVLILQVPGLSHEIDEVDYCAKVAMIQETLKSVGVEAEILVNGGFTLRQYAAQQEKLALKRKQAMDEAVTMLKATRSWFKDRRLADIRYKLEQAK